MLIWNIIVTLLLVFMNGFFVAAEFALVKIRNSQIEIEIRNGSFLAGIVRGIKTHLDGYLSATQLGITLASLGLGWIGEGMVAGIILNFFNTIHIHLEPELAHKIALPVAFLSITFLHIVFGELAPKSIAIQRTVGVSLFVAIPLRIFYFLFKPLIWLLATTSDKILKLLSINTNNPEHDLHSPDELRYLLEESAESGLFDSTEHELLENVFDFADTPVKQIMVPQNKVVALELNTDYEVIVTKFIEEGYSRMPVYSDSIDNIIGIIYAKDILSMVHYKGLIIPHDIIRPVCFIQENLMINELLKKLQKDHVHLAVVLDEFGGTAGIVTMEDILEELVGEIQDEYDEEQPLVTKLNKNEYLVLAQIAIADANEFLPLPLPEHDDYETVGGLITSIIGKIPNINDEIELDQYLCRIVKCSNISIESVKLIVNADLE
ncbi:MAG: hemolysin family protein [Candidatus Kapabacteria bacterium]|nr:hemolysin family protein [Candidatus Kapabacteria bacterium]